jgi:hypothetical protein
MPIVSSDIQTRLSGGSANGVPPNSIGGAVSSNIVPPNLFYDVPAADSVTGRVQYRCIYVYNTNPTLTLENAVAWLQANGGGTLAIGRGVATVDNVETAVGNENTAPAGVTFSTAPNEGAAISLGSIPSGRGKSVWIRRTIGPGAAATAITATVRVKGETQP